MKIKFDPDIKLAGIGITPWPRVGLERWLSAYKIASYYDWDINDEAAPEVISFSGGQRPAKLNTLTLLENQVFCQELILRLPGYNLLTYKPTKYSTPKLLSDAGIKVLAAESSDNYEDKAKLRNQFANQLPFPPFKITENPKPSDGPQLGVGSKPLMLQDQAMSGGRGSFVIDSQQDFEMALKNLEALGKAKTIVVSDYLEGCLERSLQCVVTRFGSFVGPLQKQIIGNDQLMNPKLRKDSFCGAEIDDQDPTSGLYQEMKSYCEIIAKKLKESGYKGIFGVDFLVSKTGKVYVLEVNQRMTGVTPLLTALYRGERDVPFFLLHALELGNFDYEITDPSADNSGLAGSLLVLHSKDPNPTRLLKMAASGLYDQKASELLKSTTDYRELVENKLILQRYFPLGTKLPAGAKLAQLFTRTRVLDQDDNLLPEASELATKIYSPSAVTGVD